MSYWWRLSLFLWEEDVEEVFFTVLELWLVVSFIRLGYLVLLRVPFLLLEESPALSFSFPLLGV